MMERCPGGKLLSQYVDGEVAPADAERIRRHRDQCPACAALLRDIQAADQALRRETLARSDSAAEDEMPDVAGRVTADLARQGSFLAARIAAGKRRLFGDRLPVGRLAMVLSVAAAIVLAALVGLDYFGRADFGPRSEPVLADAERVLVRLVWVQPSEQKDTIARAGAQVRRLALPQRLALVRARADAEAPGDLDLLERTFTLIAEGRDLPPDLAAQLDRGELLQRTERLRESLALAR